MLEKTAFARPYAEAAFVQARAENSLNQWSAMLQQLGMVASDPQMRKLISNPRVSREQLESVVLDVCGDRLSGTGSNFARILVRSKRLVYARQICELFEQHRANLEGVLEVEVISAFPMEPEQVTRIVELMKKRDGRDIEISTRVDASLIGGIIIRAGDSVIDASVRGRLRQMHQEFI